MKPVYQAYIGYLDELGGVLEELTAVAREKVAAAHTGDLQALDRCMKQEQAFSMTLRGMDQKRAKMLAEMGVSDVPLSQLAEYYPEELRAQAAKAAEGALARYDSYISASNAAFTALECVLKDIERMMPEDQRDLGNQPPAPPPKMKTDFRA